MDDKKDQFIDAGDAESEQFEADDEVQQEFAEAQRLASGGQILARELREHHSESPADTAGDIDADWQRADDGEEAPGGSTPTPDQDVVDESGMAHDDAVLGLVRRLQRPRQPRRRIAKSEE